MAPRRFYWFMEKRKQASRTPNASRNTTSRSMSERQGVRGLLNLAAAFGVREACFRFGLSHASMLFGIGRTGKLESCFCFYYRFNAQDAKGLKGERLHEYICFNMKREIRSDPSWWKRLLRLENATPSDH